MTNNSRMGAAAAQRLEQHRRRDGKFGEQMRGEADVDVAGQPPLQERAWFTVADLYDYTRDGNGAERSVMSATGVRFPSKDARFTNVVVKFGGHGYVRQATGMAAVSYPPVPHDELVDDAPRKVTLLTRGPNGDVDTRQGTIYDIGGRPFLMKKGSKSSGWYADDLNVLAVKDGYNKDQELADEFAEKLKQVPVTEPASLSGIPYEEDTDGERGAAAVFVYDHPGIQGGPDGAAGCVFVATDLTRNGDNPIVNGYFWAPDDSGLESEWSSMYWHDLTKPGMGAARLSGDCGVDTATFWKDAPADRAGMYTYLGDRMEPVQ